MKRTYSPIVGLSLLAAFGAPSAFADNAALLDSIAAPREAIDLSSTNAWSCAFVTNGTAWNDPGIEWETQAVPARAWWGMWSKPPKPNEAYYRRTFSLAPEQARQTVSLFFELVAPMAEIVVNGHSAYTQLDATTPFRCDITPFVKAGENELDVRCYYEKLDGKDAPGAVGWVMSQFTGISRPVHVEIRNPVHIVETRIQTDVFPEKNLLAEVLVTNGTDHAESVQLSGLIEDDDGAPKLSAPAVRIPPQSASVVKLSVPWSNVKLWSPADPALYNLLLTLDVAGAKADPLDALRTRFGFREFGIDGKRLTLNGHPFINRRNSVSLGSTQDQAVDVNSERTRNIIRLLKSRGFVGARVGTHTLYRDSRIADEEGFILSVLPSTGAAYVRRDPYWSATSNLVGNVVRTFRNAPSIFYWGLFNEFGQFYGLSNASVQTPKTVEIGRYAESLDPTRFWCSHGDAEMGVPAKGSGPSAVRSIHYPINLSYGGNDFPEIAYWYAEGRSSCWQGLGSHSKPVMISEDLYHGMNDKPFSMGKWGNDDIYEVDGYVRAWRDAVAMLADGYYYGGIGEWDPWFTDSTTPGNPLFADGQLMPDFLIARRHGYANVTSDSEFKDSLHVYNELFAPVDCTLTRVDSFNGKTTGKPEVEHFTLAPGERRDSTLAFHVPRVKGSAPGRYEVAYALTSGTNTLATRTFDFNVLPGTSDYPMPKGVVLLDYGTNSSPVRALFAADGVLANAASIPAGSSVAVVTGTVPRDEGSALNNWVVAGGQAILLADANSGWSPVGIDVNKAHSYAWRRTADFLPDVDNSLWRAWRPNASLGDRAIVKDSALDLDVLVDSSTSGGFTHADIVRLPRGSAGGSWIVTTLPVNSCFDDEPAAVYLVTRLAHEQEERAALGPKAARNGTYSFLANNHPYASWFKQNGFPKPVGKGYRGDIVLIADGSRPLSPEAADSILNHARAGGTVILAETTATNRAFLAELGLGVRPRGAAFYFRGNQSGHILSPFGLRYTGPYNVPGAPKIFEGDKPFSPEERKEIVDLLDNGGSLCIMRECPENRQFITRAFVDWRAANRDWFTRRGSPDLLAGVSNSDLFFSDVDLPIYYRWKMINGGVDPGLGVYPEQNPVSHGALYGLAKSEDVSLAKDVESVAFLLHPAVLADVQVGQGHIYVSTIDFNNIGAKYPQRFIRLWRQILGNLGVRTSTTIESVRYVSANLGSANARLWDDPAGPKSTPVVFPDGNDLRYFPVNLCGWSLSANNKCPVEPFPQEAILYGGIPFIIRAPSEKWKDVSAVLIADGKGGAAVATPGHSMRVKRVWVLAAMAKAPSDPKQLSGEEPVLDSLWANGVDPWHQSDSKAYYKRDMGVFSEPAAPTGKGRIGWEGPTGKGKPGALYVFPLDNPWNPSIPVERVHIRGCKGVNAAILGVTFEGE